MKRLLPVLMVFAVLLGSVGESFALPKCLGSPITSSIARVSAWDNCKGTHIRVGKGKYVGEWKYGKENGQGIYYQHDFGYSRRRTDFHLAEAQIAEYPAARHRLVQTNLVTGRKSLMIGAHAKGIVGWPGNKGLALLDGLLRRATEEQSIYGREWRQDDVVVSDNRSTLHRATEYDVARYRRVTQRTTISNIVAQ